MSGRKRSRITFDDGFRHAAELSRVRKSIEKNCKLLRKEMAAIPAIVRDRLKTATDSIERWLSDTDAAIRSPMSTMATIADVTSWQSRAQGGQQLLQNLSKSTLLEIDRCHSEISVANEECSSRLESHRGLIETWLTATVVLDLERRIASARSTLNQGDLAEALRQSTEISKEVSNTIESAKVKEGQHVHNELLREVQQLQRDLKNCCHALATTCSKANETIGIDLADCRRWLRETEPLISSSIPDDESNPNLKRLSESCRKATTNGLQLLDESRRELEEKLAVLRSDFGTRLQLIQQRWTSEEEGMDRWLSTTERESAKEALGEWQRHLSQSRFSGLEQLAATTEAALTSCLDRLSSFKERHESRLHVLKALRQVCSNLGFGEISPPRHLVEGDYTSRIALIVNTFNRGQLTFYLSLDEIEADSCIEKSHCHFEFGKLSEQLRNQFGIHTKFESAETAPPQVIKKDEIDEPTGSGESSQA